MSNSGEGKTVAQLKARVNDRSERIKEIFEQFLIDYGHVGYLDSGLLVHTVQQYFIASDRMKRIHNIPYTDSHKRASYTTWAINKFKPVRYVGTPDKSRILANELFSLHAGLSHLDLRIDDFSLDELETLLYLLHTHDIDPDWLAVIMYLLEQRTSLIVKLENKVESLEKELKRVKIQSEKAKDK